VGGKRSEVLKERKRGRGIVSSPERTLIFKRREEIQERPKGTRAQGSVKGNSERKKRKKKGGRGKGRFPHSVKKRPPNCGRGGKEKKNCGRKKDSPTAQNEKRPLLSSHKEMKGGYWRLKKKRPMPSGPNGEPRRRKKGEVRGAGKEEILGAFAPIRGQLRHLPSRQGRSKRKVKTGGEEPVAGPDGLERKKEQAGRSRRAWAGRKGAEKLGRKRIDDS